MANIKISAAAQDNFNKIKIGDRVLSQDEYQRFSRKLKIVMYDVSASIQENYSKIKWDEYQRFLRKLQIVMDDVSASMKKISDDFTQFDEDKRDGFYSYKEKYSNYLKEKKGFIDPKYIDFISFWIEYNSKYLDLKYCFDDKYKLVPGDYFLYIEYEALIFFDRKTKEEALEIIWKVHDKNRSSPPAAKGMDNKAVEDKKVIRKGIKSTTKDRYDNMLYRICDLVENKWMKESDKTVEKLEKIYKKAKGEYAKSNGTDPSYLNTMLKNTDGFEYIKIKLMKLYRENK